LRQKALKSNDKETIREVANKFEAMFATMLIKSMRQANEAFETDCLFNNKNTKFYTYMQDKQLALDISRHGSLGLADALVRQLDPMAISATKTIDADKLMMPNSEQDKQFSLQKIQEKAEFSKPDQTLAVQGNQAKNEQPNFKDPGSFIQTLLPYAKKVAKALGISPAVLIAQSALETGWGKKIINHATDQKSSFNLFNIKANKAWQGDKVSKNSLEVENATAVMRNSNFRSYENVSSRFEYCQRFVTENPRYTQALKQGDNAERYIEELHQAGYGTDPQYAQKIKNIMNSESFKRAVNGGEF